MLGHEDFCDNIALSDIKIKFGRDGRREFLGHKILLSGQSEFFRAAFRGGFAESTANEMTLKGDDPDALKAILDTVYRMGNPKVGLPPFEFEPNTPEASIIVLTRMSQLGIADKYQFDIILEGLIDSMRTDLFVFVDIIKDAADQMLFKDVFLEILEHMYELPPRAKGHVADELLTLCNPRGLELAQLLHAVAKEHLEFGRDLFVHLMHDVSHATLPRPYHLTLSTYSWCECGGREELPFGSSYKFCIRCGQVTRPGRS